MMVQPLQFLTKLNMHLPHNPATSFLGIYSHELKHKSMSTEFITGLFTTGRTWGVTTMPSIGKWTQNVYINAVKYHSVTRKMKYQAIESHGGNLNAYC